MTAPALSRRTLLVAGGAGAGLVIAFSLWPRRSGSPLRPAKGEAVLGAYLRIAEDGRVTLAVPQVETGQGIWTGLAQLVADELGAAWTSMAVEPAPPGDAYANRLLQDDLGMATRITALASSIRAFETPLREAAATARLLLCRAAAEIWGVDPAECDSSDGHVVHEGKRLGFGALAARAAILAPPSAAPLRPTGSGRLAGQPLPRLDLGAKSDGSLRFASDVRLPAMLFASARIAPPGGRLVGYDRTAARARGPVELVEGSDWLAALADNWWSADRALGGAALRFEGPVFANVSAALGRALEEGRAETLVRIGDYRDATAGSTPLAATYAIAPLPHRSLEPQSAAARRDGDMLEVWAGTQMPDIARRVAAHSAGMAENQVRLYPMPVGDNGGGGLALDAVRIAAALAMRSRRPVSLTLPPATALNQDSVRPPLLTRMTALPSADGTIRAWSARLAGMAGLEALIARATGGDRPGFAPAAAPPYRVGAVRIEAVDADLPIRTGYARGGVEAMIAFATESFVDELARAIGAEPLSFRIGMLGGAPRLARALMSAATIGGWDGGRPGSAMGLACARLFGSHIALLAEASVGADQRIRVSRLMAAVDAGRVVNPGLVRQQVTGDLLSALAAANVPAPTYVAAMPRAAPFGDAGYERLRDVPRVEVEIVSSDAAPGGVSGLGWAVLAPAVANAIAASTGKRLRNLPFDPMSL